MNPKYICLESKFAAFNSQTGTYHFKLSNQIVINKSMRLIYASVPNTVYNVIDGVNNAIDFNALYPNGNWGAAYHCFIPSGDYDVDSLAQQLETTLNNTLDLDWAVTYNDITNLFTFTTTVSAVVLRWGTGANNKTSIASVLGFENADVSGSTITTTQMPSLLEPQIMYVNVNNIGNSNVTTTNYQSQFTIPLTGGNGNYCVFNEQSQYKQEIVFPSVSNLFSFFDIALYCYMGTSSLPITYNSKLNFVLMFEYN